MSCGERTSPGYAADQGQSDAAEDDRCLWPAHSFCVAQDVVHAAREFGLLLPCSERKGHGAMVERAFREAGEAGCVGLGGFGEPENGVVAGYLALKAEALFDPDECWVYGEENQSQLLDQVEPVVCPVEMAELVKDDLLELGWSELVEEPLRDENPRREETDDAGAVDLG